MPNGKGPRVPPEIDAATPVPPEIDAATPVRLEIVASTPVPPEILAAAEGLAKLRPFDPDAADRIGKIIYALLRRGGKIENVASYLARLWRVFPRRPSSVMAPRSVRPFVSRVVWAQRRLYNNVVLNRDDGGHARWRGANEVDEDLVVVTDLLRQQELAARAKPSEEPKRKKPVLTIKRVRQVREALSRRSTALEEARDEAVPGDAGAALTADDIQAIDDTLRRSTLSGDKKQFLAAVMFAYSMYGGRSTIILAERASERSKTTITPGAIEWQFHRIVSRLRSEAIEWCCRRPEFDEGLTWVFSSFESAAALEAAKSACPPTLDCAKALALIGQHLGLPNSDLRLIGPWESLSAVGVRLNQARETLRRLVRAPSGFALDLPRMTFLRTFVPSEVVARVAGFSPGVALLSPGTHKDRLEFIEARWFKQIPDSTARGLPMSDRTDDEVGASATDDVVRAVADCWNDERARPHLSPGELRVSLSSPPDREMGPLATRVALHLEACASCRLFRAALIEVASMGDLSDADGPGETFAIHDGPTVMPAATAPSPKLHWFARLRAWLNGAGGGPVRRWPALIVGMALGIAIVASLPPRQRLNPGHDRDLSRPNDNLVDIKGGASGFSSDIWCLSNGGRRSLSFGDQCGTGSFLEMRVSLPASEPGALSVLMCRSRPSQCRFLSGPSVPMERRAVDLYWPVVGPREKANVIVIWSQKAPDKLRIEKNLDRSPDPPDITGVLQGLTHTQGILRSFEITRQD